MDTHGRSRQPRSVDPHRRTKPPARRASLDRVSAHRLDRRRLACRRGLGACDDERDRSRRDPRPASRAAVRLRSPSDRPRGSHPAHAADRARLRRRRHRPSVSRSAGDDGAAPRARQTPHPRRAHSVRDPRSRADAGAAHAGARGDLRRVRDRLLARRRNVRARLASPRKPTSSRRRSPNCCRTSPRHSASRR